MFRDLTQVDREKRQVLVQEMKVKNDELLNQNVLDSKWIIRGDKVIKIKVRPNQSF